MKETAVVILNYNGKNYLERFLPSVSHCSNNCTIYIADNGSTDDSIFFIKENYPEIECIELGRNYGYAEGYNCALNHIKAKYYVLLNSDVEVTENWIEPIVDLFECHPNVAAIQPKILSYHQRDYFEYAGASGGFLDRYYFPYCRGRVFDDIEQDKGQYDDCLEIDWASGACMFIRSEVYHQLDGLEKSFFAHMEEIDLCLRIARAGLKTVCLPKSIVYHVGGGTLPKNHPKKTYLNMRNNLSMITLNDKNPLKIHAIRLIIDFLALFWLLVHGQFKTSLSVLRAYIDYLRSLSYLLSLRKNRKKKYPCIKGKEDKIFLLWEYFCYKKKTFDALHKS
jgi:GT2 family glycosyltransferase